MTVYHTHKSSTSTHTSLNSPTLGFDVKPIIVPTAEINQTHYLNDNNVTQICSESDYGNVEYKYKIVQKSLYRLNTLITQLKWRLAEGNGAAVYIIGIHDNGVAVGLNDTEFNESVDTLKCMAESINAEILILHVSQGINGKCAEILIREETIISNNLVSLRIGCIGSHCSGKSTLVGTLISNEQDDGAGLSRMNVLKHRHEIESNGRSSCIARHIVGFDINGKIINHRAVGSDDWQSIINDSVKVITMYDLPGHAQYIKTTILSLIGQHADYACVTIAADEGMINVTKEHIGLTIALDIPIFVIITKIDLIDDTELQTLVTDVNAILTSTVVNKQPYIVSNDIDVLKAAKKLQNDTNITPILCVSSVTHTNYNLLTSFLHHIPKNCNWEVYESDPAMYTVDESFIVPDVGVVVSGTVLRGCINRNDTLLLGPTDDGSFIECTVSSIHVQRRSTKCTKSGESCTLALSGVEFDQIRRGHVLLHSQHKPRAIVAFDATIQLLNTPATGKLPNNYESVVHLSTITQSTHITEIYDNTKDIVVGDTATVRFDLCYTPEYILVGSKFVGRGSCVDGRSKIIYSGIVTKVYYLDECQLIHEHNTDSDDNTTNKSTKHKRKQRRLSLMSRLATHSPSLTNITAQSSPVCRPLSEPTSTESLSVTSSTSSELTITTGACIDR